MTCALTGRCGDRPRSQRHSSARTPRTRWAPTPSRLKRGSHVSPRRPSRPSRPSRPRSEPRGSTSPRRRPSSRLRASLPCAWCWTTLPVSSRRPSEHLTLSPQPSALQSHPSPITHHPSPIPPHHHPSPITLTPHPHPHPHRSPSPLTPHPGVPLSLGKHPGPHPYLHPYPRGTPFLIRQVSIKNRFDFGPADHAKFMGLIGLTYALSQGLVAKPLVKLFGHDPTRLLLLCILLLGGSRPFALLTSSIYIVYALYIPMVSMHALWHMHICICDALYIQMVISLGRHPTRTRTRNPNLKPNPNPGPDRHPNRHPHPNRSTSCNPSRNPHPR